MRKAIWVAAFLCSASAAQAHDFWLQPRSFQATVNTPVPFTIQVGHGKDRQRWAGRVERVVQFRSLGPTGAVDHKADLKAQPSPVDAEIAFRSPGVHVVVFETTPAESDLPALRFNDYAKAEGLTPALRFREQTKSTDKPGRELYSRRCKALIRVGQPDGKPQPQVTRPVGLTLEIVPERDPYALGPNDDLPVRILFEGRPLSGALVKLTSLEFDARPIATHLSDSAGRAAFKVPRTGTWLLNVIWTKPISNNPKADFETTFSSLTFSFWRG